jgi:hypothetical protein
MNSTTWLNQIVCCNDEYIPRRRAIWQFVSRNLVPLLFSHGYIVYSDKSLACGIATLLYTNRNLSCLETYTQPRQVVENLDEYLIHYYHVMNESAWNSMWSSCASWSDISEESYWGLDRRLDIQAYCWTQINLEESPQTQVVNDLLSFDVEVQGQTRAEDTYIKEAADSNEWGGYRR